MECNGYDPIPEQHCPVMPLDLRHREILKPVSEDPTGYCLCSSLSAKAMNSLKCSGGS